MQVAVSIKTIFLCCHSPGSVDIFLQWHSWCVQLVLILTIDFHIDDIEFEPMHMHLRVSILCAHLHNHPPAPKSISISIYYLAFIFRSMKPNREKNGFFGFNSNGLPMHMTTKNWVEMNYCNYYLSKSKRRIQLNNRNIFHFRHFRSYLQIEFCFSHQSYSNAPIFLLQKLKNSIPSNSQKNSSSKIENANCSSKMNRHHGTVLSLYWK